MAKKIRIIGPLLDIVFQSSKQEEMWIFNWPKIYVVPRAILAWF